MKYMGAAEFKAKCLKVVDEVLASGEEVVITKRGKPVARVVPPIPEEPTPNYWGWGTGTVEVAGDLLVPMDTTGWTLDGELWDKVFPDPDHAPRFLHPTTSYPPRVDQ